MKEEMVSPYLLKPTRSYEQFLRERAEIRKRRAPRVESASTASDHADTRAESETQDA